MNPKKNLLPILVSFANKHNSPHINFRDFCDYMKRYAQHNMPTHPELAPYTTNPEAAMQNELDALQEKGLIFLSNYDSDKRSIVVISAYVDKYATRYMELINNPSIPFPVLKDLPKLAPLEMLEQQPANGFLSDLFLKEDEGSEVKTEETEATKIETKKLYSLAFSGNLPTVIFPSTIKASLLFDIAIAKLRNILRKEEFHDYFLKRLRVSNTGKDLSVKNFFTNFIQKPSEFLESIKNTNDYFYFWSQLGYFIRQDYEKVNEYTQEHINILQSISIIDIGINYYKHKSQKNYLKKNALTHIEKALQQAPYYFEKKTIKEFTDSNGAPLLAHCPDEVLNDFLVEKTTEAENEELPELLTFKVYTGERFYIYKQNVIPLVIRLCNEARDVVKRNLITAWFEVYKRHDVLPEMSDPEAFEKCLETEIRSFSAILEALLNAHFLPLLHYDAQNNVGRILLFSGGKRLPYSELLMLSRREISTDAKILLPVWYSIPILNWLIRFLLNPKKYLNGAGKPKKSKETTEMKVVTVDEKAEQRKRKEDFRKAAKEAEAKIIPEGSSIEKELSLYESEWNRILDKKNSKNLTEDVNALIRDYMRKTIRTIKASTFSVDRIQNLTETLIQNSSFSKITHKEPLKKYVLLYIIKIIKNI